MYSSSMMKQRVLLKGKDGVDLIHRLSTINLLSLSKKTQGLILNPAGKIISVFEVTQRSPSELEINFNESFLKILDQYTFAEKYELLPLEPLATQEISEKDRILKLQPKIGNEFLEDGQTNPLEINLRSAIHENKGCYPGQEVIEKIISLGSPPRKLGLLKEIDATEAQKIQESQNSLSPIPISEAGTITSSVDGFALAILKRTHQKKGLLLKTDTKTYTLLEIS